MHRWAYVSSKNNNILPTLQPSKESCIWLSNPIAEPIYEYLSGSPFLVNLAPQNKQFFKLKSESEFRGHESNSQTIKNLPHFFE